MPETPFVGQICMVGFNFAPVGWAFCNGQLLPISEFETLFNLIGTTYGGNGTTSFALPNLQGSVPIHMGSGFVLGQLGGEAAHTLTVQELPTHTHPLSGTSSAATAASPAGNLLAQTPIGMGNAYGPFSEHLVVMDASALSNVGSSQAHENRQPYLAVNFIIALFGVFPTQA